MKPKTRRLLWIIAGVTSLTVAAFILMFTLRDNLVFFYSPTELAEKQLGPNTSIRLGGLVKAGTITHNDDSSIQFIVTDLDNDITVKYQGLLPDLFREGQGVVAIGIINEDGIFIAEQLLAKHDENYVPKEVSKALDGKMEP